MEAFRLCSAVIYLDSPSYLLYITHSTNRALSRTPHRRAPTAHGRRPTSGKLASWWPGAETRIFFLFTARPLAPPFATVAPFAPLECMYKGGGHPRRGPRSRRGAQSHVYLSERIFPPQEREWTIGEFVRVARRTAWKEGSERWEKYRCSAACCKISLARFVFPLPHHHALCCFSLPRSPLPPSLGVVLDSARNQIRSGDSDFARATLQSTT